MDRLILLPLLLLSLLGYSQTISYTLVIKNSCDGKISPAYLYHLTKEGKAFAPSDSLGTIQLQDTGRYVVSSLLLPDNLVVHLDEYKSYSDTLSAKRIEQCLEPVSHPSFVGYCCCMQKCEGYQEDYYNNGKVRVTGTFKEGHPVGELTFFYPSGKKKEVHLYDKRGRGRLKQKTFYNADGEIERTEK